MKQYLSKKSLDAIKDELDWEYIQSQKCEKHKFLFHQ